MAHKSNAQFAKSTIGRRKAGFRHAPRGDFIIAERQCRKKANAQNTA